MKTLTFIGTLHAGLTPHEELQAVLEKQAPELLLVEIVQADVESDTTEQYPDEMQFALRWAREHDVPVKGFDCGIDVFAKGKSDQDNQEAIEEQKLVLEKYSWKDANTKKVDALLNTPKVRALVDPVKDREREEEMAANIRAALPLLEEEKNTVVVTGTAHLNFFEQEFPDASFPLR